MPAKDTYHDCVRRALEKEGWVITEDPYTIRWELKDVFVDLAAERPIAAERGNDRIAVEIKSFRGPSDLRDFEDAFGQYLFYHSLMIRSDPDRRLFMAIPDFTYANTFQEPIVRPALQDFHVALIVFRPSEERIVQWIP